VTVGWDDPRPIPVGIGGFLLIGAGVIQLFVAALYVALFGPPALLVAVPMTALGVGGVLFGWRIRSGRNRSAAIGTAFLISLTSPFTLSVPLATATIICALIALVALIRYRTWFEPPPDGAPPTEVEPPAEGGPGKS